MEQWGRYDCYSASVPDLWASQSLLIYDRGGKMPRLVPKLVLNLCNLGHVGLSIIVIISLDSVYHHFQKTHTSSLPEPKLRPSFKVSNNK